MSLFVLRNVPAMRLRALIVLATTFLGSLQPVSGSISTRTSTANEISKGSDTFEAEPTEHADLKLRADCPVPCGWKNWLCCNSNEICYTAPNLEASCAPTALPSDSTDTVTVPIFVLTSLVRSTRVITKTLSLSQKGHESHRTSVVTLTSVETSTVRYSSPLSKPTVVGSHHHNATQIQEKQQTGLSTAKKAAIGASISGAAVLVAAVIIICCLRRKRNKRSEEPHYGDGTDSLSPRNFAHVHEKSLAPSMRTEDIVPFLQPRQSAILRGPGNPYAGDPDGAAPPYRPAQAHVAGHQQPSGLSRSSLANGQQQYQAPQASGPPRPSGRSTRGVLPRKPVGPMQPSAEDDYEY